MIIRKRLLAPVTGLLLLGLTACESTEKKHTAATPPAKATAPTITAQARPQPQPKPQEVKPAPKKDDTVDALIAGVDKQYAEGQANYSAGHLEAAKKNFDEAFNMLVSGPVEVHSDERLENEFDKIVDGTNSLELLALQQGDGFTEQQSTPAPIDEANQVTFPVDPRIKAQAEQEVKATHSDLPLVMNDTVAMYINYFSHYGRGVLEKAWVRAGRYRSMIERIFREEGVPQDLIYLAQAESGFQPLAVSHASARGMWQFMMSRAVDYGLRRDWWVDERQDPEKSTRAAAKHLKDLYKQFGDWYLAMAAYNSGPGTVMAAVQRTGYADFWELYRRGVLPAETKNYVPIIVAVTIMAKNPAQYGLQNIVPDEAPAVDTVAIDYPVDLRLVAECVDTNVATLQELNPSLLRMTTPKGFKFDLKLPAGTKDKYLTSIAAIPPDKRVLWRYHRVEPGDTLTSLAQRYHTRVRAIAEVNGLDDDDDNLPRDSKLIIPVTGKGGDEAIAYSKQVVRYRVRPGDTVLSVADDWGVPPAKIRLWNRLKGNHLTKGRVLFIHRPLDANYHAATGERSLRGSGHGKTSAAKSHKSSKPNASAGDADVASSSTNAKRTSASNEQQ